MFEPRTVILLNGVPGAGKNKTGELLKTHLESRCVLFNIADTVREQLLAINPPVWVHCLEKNIPLKDLIEADGWEFVKRTFPEVRKMLQGLAQSGRDIHEVDHWMRVTGRKIGTIWEKEHEKYLPPSLVVICDHRYNSEREYIRKNLSAKTITIKLIGRGDNLPTELMKHPSESEIIQPDYVISNTGTLEDLWLKVRDILVENKLPRG